MSKKKALYFVQALTSLFLVGVIVFFLRDKLDVIWSLLVKMDKRLFSLIFILFIVSHFLIAFRLNLILRAQEIHITLMDSFRVVMSGLFFCNLIPSMLGGEMAKGVYTSKVIGKTHEVYSSIILDKLIGLLTLFSTGFIALLFYPEALKNTYLSKGMFFLGVFCFAAILFFFNKRLGKFLLQVKKFIPVARFQVIVDDIYHAIHEYHKHPKVLLFAVFISYAMQSIVFMLVYGLSVALHVEVPMGLFFVFLPLIFVSGMAPSVNGIGVREALYVFCFANYCLPENAVAIGVLNNLLLVLSGIVGGIIVAFSGKIKLLNIVRSHSSEASQTVEEY